MLKGCQVFLAHVTIKETEDKLKENDLRMYRQFEIFPEVFPEDLPEEGWIISNVHRLSGTEQADDEELLPTPKDQLRGSSVYSMIDLRSVQFLGHMIDSQGIHVDLAKIKSIKGRAYPKAPTDIRQLLSLSSYYQKFIERFLGIAKSMTKLTQKGVKFDWGDKQEAAF
ncbi:hypothetical protein Tco_1116537 [Tanacetum coccineum]